MPNRKAKNILLATAIPLLISAITSCSPAAPPADEKTLMSQAQAAEQARKWDEAIDRSQQAIKINKKNLDAHMILANAYFESKQFQKAVDECTEMMNLGLLQTHQQLQDVYFLKGMAYMNLDDLKSADTWFQDAYAEETETFNPMLFAAYGQCLLKEKKYGEAIRMLDQAIAMQPKIAQLYWMRGKAKGNNGDVAGATQDYDQASALEPGNAEIASNYAELLEMQKQYRQGLYVLAIAAETNPQAEAASKTVHDRIWQKALQQAQEDQRKRPQAPVPHAYLSFLYMDKNDLPNSKLELQKALELHGDDIPLAWRIKGDIAALSGNYQEAITDYDKAFAVFKPSKPGRDLGTELTKIHKDRVKEKLGSQSR